VILFVAHREIALHLRDHSGSPLQAPEPVPLRADDVGDGAASFLCWLEHRR
jgi:hypothetical protein